MKNLPRSAIAALLLSAAPDLAAQERSDTVIEVHVPITVHPATRVRVSSLVSLIDQVPPTRAARIHIPHDPVRGGAVYALNDNHDILLVGWSRGQALYLDLASTAEAWVWVQIQIDTEGTFRLQSARDADRLRARVEAHPEYPDLLLALQRAAFLGRPFRPDDQRERLRRIARSITLDPSAKREAARP